VKDFQRAKWLVEELNKKPYDGSPSGDKKKLKKREIKGIEDTDDPEIIQGMIAATERLKEKEKFEDNVVQVFDPMSLRSEETSRPTASRQGRVYDMQVKHTTRLL
jgi:hypothetical protein